MSTFDFSRGTFDTLRNYTSVLQQQGRVQLDVDADEDAEANSEKIHRLTADTATPFVDPASGPDTASIAPTDPAAGDVGPTVRSGAPSNWPDWVSPARW